MGSLSSWSRVWGSPGNLLWKTTLRGIAKASAFQNPDDGAWDWEIMFVCTVCIFIGMIELQHSQQPDSLDQRASNLISLRPLFVDSVSETPYHPTSRAIAGLKMQDSDYITNIKGAGRPRTMVDWYISITIMPTIIKMYRSFRIKI